ncbi:MAG: hypothetical protein WBO70_05505 [Erysipelotrichaceae bacterium]
MKNNKGNMLIEVLLSLMICSFLVVILSNLLNIFSKVNINTISIQNEIGVNQLRTYLLSGYNFLLEDDQCLSYYRNFEYYRLEIINNRLVQHPGTLIFLLESDDIYFEKKGDEIYLINDMEERLIAYESKGYD